MPDMSEERNYFISGDRVLDPDTGRTGTYHTGRFSGEPSICWDDDPTVNEFYYEGILEPLEVS
jgi:hypothetical protein